MSKCLVTGASGLVGSHLVRALCSDYEVVTLGRKPVEHLPKASAVTHLPMDFTDHWNPDEIPGPIEAIIHLSQSERFREFPETAEEVFQVNTLSTLKLLDYARKTGVKTFIFASTGGVYGNGDEPFSEETAISFQGDPGFYAGTKLCSEILVQSYAKLMNVVTLRFFFVYGPGQRSGMLIPRLVESVKTGAPITTQGKDGLKINPIYVSDAVQAIQKAITLNQNQTFNIGGPDTLCLREIGEIIGKVLNQAPNFNQDLQSTPKDLIGDITKMSTLLAPPQVRFEAGVRRYVQETYHELLV